MRKRLPSTTLFSPWDFSFSALSCGLLQLVFFKARNPMVNVKISGAGLALTTTDGNFSKRMSTMVWFAECRLVGSNIC